MLNSLLQESARFNDLILVVANTLSALLKGIKGFDVMSPSLQLMFTRFSSNTVPEVWSEKAYPSLKSLSQWFGDFISRVDFFRRWITHGNPSAFWLSAFFFPQGLLTSALQTYSRKSKGGITTVSFRTHVTNMKSKHEIRDPPAEGIYIYGLFIEGAKWDDEKRHLTEQGPRDKNIMFPIIWFEPVLGLQSRTHHRSEYNCPIYKTARRAALPFSPGLSAEHIATVKIPSGDGENHWIQRGVALIAELSE